MNALVNINVLKDNSKSKIRASIMMETTGIKKNVSQKSPMSYNLRRRRSPKVNLKYSTDEGNNKKKDIYQRGNHLNGCQCKSIE
jgi:hypothetical protein